MPNKPQPCDPPPFSGGGGSLVGEDSSELNDAGSGSGSGAVPPNKPPQLDSDFAPAVAAGGGAEGLDEPGEHSEPIALGSGSGDANSEPIVLVCGSGELAKYELMALGSGSGANIELM